MLRHVQGGNTCMEKQKSTQAQGGAQGKSLKTGYSGQQQHKPLRRHQREQSRVLGTAVDVTMACEFCVTVSKTSCVVVLGGDDVKTGVRCLSSTSNRGRKRSKQSCERGFGTYELSLVCSTRMKLCAFSPQNTCEGGNLLSSECCSHTFGCYSMGFKAVSK